MPSTFIPRPPKQIPQEERELPVALTSKGEPVPLSRMAAQPVFLESLQEPSPECDRRLAIERIRARKGFRIGILGLPSPLTRERAIREIEQDTEVGQQLVRMEVSSARRYLEAATREGALAGAGSLNEAGSFSKG